MAKRPILPALVVCVVGASVAAAVTPDHLRCYKVRDSAPRAFYAADVSGLAPGATGCRIAVPGQLLCVEATKTNVDPAPPGSGSGTAAGAFLCYKLKCPRSALSEITWSDQFGTRAVTPIGSKLLCAPAVSTTTSSTTTTTTLLPPPCVGEGAPCAGACGTGICGVHCGAGENVCASNAAGSCDTSLSCTSDANCTGGKVCISSPGAACTEAFCCSPCS